MSNFRRFLCSLGSAALLAGSATSANAASYLPCFYQSEMQSARIHDFRVMMLVNALKCPDTASGNLRSYGDFVTSRDADINYHADRLEQRMMEELGSRTGRLAFDDYETTLGNYYSQEGHALQSCSDLGAYARMAHRANDDELAMISKMATGRKIESCELRGNYVADEDSLRSEHTTVRVIRGAVPALIARVREEASVEVAEKTAIAAKPIVEAPVVPLANEDDVAMADAYTRPAERIAAAQVAAVDQSPQGSNARLDKAIAALDSAAQALRELKEPAAGAE